MSDKHKSSVEQWSVQTRSHKITFYKFIDGKEYFSIKDLQTQQEIVMDKEESLDFAQRVKDNW